MKIRHLFALLASLGLAFGAAADDHGAEEKPSFHASQSVRVSAVVEEINHETREVTLRRADDTLIEIVASEEARNLDQVHPGDIVNAEYIESIDVQVFENDGMEPDAAVAAAIARTEAGEMPGVAAMETAVIAATVEDINLEDNTFKLKMPDGSVNQYTAMNPDNLRRADVGDLVVITMTEAMAITVEEQPAAE